jgi:hypothetical protein
LTVTEVRYVGDFEAVEVDRQVIRKGDTVEVDTDRAKELVANGDFERVSDKQKKKEEPDNG